MALDFVSELGLTCLQLGLHSELVGLDLGLDSRLTCLDIGLELGLMGLDLRKYQYCPVNTFIE